MDLIQRSLDAGVPHACTVADALYGNSTDFREFLRDRKEPYALAITPKNLRVILDVDEVDDGDVVPEHVFVGSPLDLAEKNGTWKTVEWAEGEKDGLSADFARWQVRVVKTEGKNRIATDEVCWLLVERIGEGTKAYLVWGMDNAKIVKQVKYAHIRWTIEKFHRDAKQELAMDCFEGRSWNGWLRKPRHWHPRGNAIRYGRTTILLCVLLISSLLIEGWGGMGPMTHTMLYLTLDASSVNLLEYLYAHHSLE